MQLLHGRKWVRGFSGGDTVVVLEIINLLGVREVHHNYVVAVQQQHDESSSLRLRWKPRALLESVGSLGFGLPLVGTRTLTAGVGRLSRRGF